jgi:hypothetical protein
MKAQDGGPSYIIVDPGTKPTSTQYTGTQPIGTQNNYTQSTGMSKEYWEKLDRRARSMIDSAW